MWPPVYTQMSEAPNPRKSKVVANRTINKDPRQLELDELPVPVYGTFAWSLVP